MVTKLRNSNCDKTQKLKLWQNSNTQIVTKVENSETEIVTKLKNSNCDKTQKLKFWQNSKTQIVTKLKNSNCEQTKNSNYGLSKKKLKLWQY